MQEVLIIVIVIALIVTLGLTVGSVKKENNQSGSSIKGGKPNREVK